MRKRLVIVLLVIGAAGASGFIVFLVRPPAVDGHVYTVAQIQQGLAHDPRRWVGRTVLVRGRVVQASWMTAAPVRRLVGAQLHIECYRPGAGECAPPLLLRYQRPGTVTHLLLAGQTYPYGPVVYVSPPQTPPAIDLIRRVPLLGRLISAPQSVYWGPYVVYRLQILKKDAASCLRSELAWSWPSACDDAALTYESP